MRNEIHPEYVACTIVCTCGNTIQTRSTKQEIHTEICSACHPFFSGKQKMMDTAGRVERFQKRYGNWKEKAAQQKQKNIEKNKEKEGGDSKTQTDKDVAAKADQPAAAAKSSAHTAKVDQPVAEAAPSDDTAKVDQPVAEAVPSDDTSQADQSAAPDKPSDDATEPSAVADKSPEGDTKPE